jgi:transposase
VRPKRPSHDKETYKGCNVVERSYRRTATRYDKMPRNYFSALCFVAAVAFWL